MVKRIICLLALVAAAATACNKNNELDRIPQPGEIVTMSVDLRPEDEVKAGNNTETVVEQSQIIVFDVNGKAEAYARTKGGESATLNISIGTKTIWAISNTEQDFSNITKLGDLEERDVLLDENTVDKMVLSGSCTYIVAKTVNKTTVTVKRYMCKVILDKISLDFTSIAMRDKKVVVKSAYITNCAGSKRIYGTGNTIVKWYNKLEHCDENMDYLLYGEINQPIQNLGSIENPQYFYILPNPYTNTSISSPWTLRKSMFVVECTIDDIPYYYPVWLPQLNSNEVYEITNFTITKSGSKLPYTPVTGEDGDVSVTGQGWGKVGTGTFRI